MRIIIDWPKGEPLPTKVTLTRDAKRPKDMARKRDMFLELYPDSSVPLTEIARRTDLSYRTILALVDREIPVDKRRAKGNHRGKNPFNRGKSTCQTNASSASRSSS